LHHQQILSSQPYSTKPKVINQEKQEMGHQACVWVLRICNKMDKLGDGTPLSSARFPRWLSVEVELLSIQHFS
jgi:hypothetical protein